MKTPDRLALLWLAIGAIFDWRWIPAADDFISGVPWTNVFWVMFVGTFFLTVWFILGKFLQWLTQPALQTFQRRWFDPHKFDLLKFSVYGKWFYGGSICHYAVLVLLLQRPDDLCLFWISALFCVFTSLNQWIDTRWMNQEQAHCNNHS